MSSKGIRASVLPELIRFGLYKANQGRRVRQATFFGALLVAAFGAVTLSNGPLGPTEQAVRVGVPLIVWVLCAWLAYRAVNVPRFADFLIAVESELEKVAWPARQEVMQATVVVLATMLFLGTFLFLMDYVWRWFFSLIHFIEYQA